MLIHLSATLKKSVTWGGGGREHFHLFLRSLLGVKTLYTSQWIHVTCTQARLVPVFEVSSFYFRLLYLQYCQVSLKAFLSNI